jgi:hypothetical protein
MPRTEIKNSTNKPKAQGLPDKLEDFLGLKDYAEGWWELSCRCCTDSDWICSAFRCGSRTTATRWPIGGCKTKGGINPPYYICEKTETKDIIRCKEIWMTQMKLKLKSYKISDVQRCVCMLGSVAVPKSYTSGSLPSGALNRKLAPQPENTYWRLHDVRRYSGDSF